MPDVVSHEHHLIDLWLEQLYNGAGQHLGGVFPPLMVGQVLTDHHRAMVADRPNQLVLGGGPNPHSCLGLVWMAPIPFNPLLLSSYVLGSIVHALDAGQAVLIHADCEAAIQTTVDQVAPMVGGGHA